jgi:hypothetical protein
VAILLDVVNHDCRAIACAFFRKIPDVTTDVVTQRRGGYDGGGVHGVLLADRLEAAANRTAIALEKVRPSASDCKGVRGRASLGPLPASMSLAVGKGPIVGEHTPTLERLRGGGGCCFVESRAKDHTAIVSRVAYFKSLGGPRRPPQTTKISSSKRT